MVPAASDGIPRVPPYSGHASQRLPLPVRGSHPLRPAFPCGSGRFRRLLRRRPYYPASRLDARGLGYSAFARRYSRNHCCFLFLRVLGCFGSPRWPRRYCGGTRLSPRGFPHSDTPGSTAIRASPGLFAACRVLLRPPKPRHPPDALNTFLLAFFYSVSLLSSSASFRSLLVATMSMIPFFLWRIRDSNP